MTLEKCALLDQIAEKALREIAILVHKMSFAILWAKRVIPPPPWFPVVLVGQDIRTGLLTISTFIVVKLICYC